MQTTFLVLMTLLMNSLAGYKTYIVAIGTACLAIYQVTQGNYDQAWALFVSAGFAATLRSALQKLIDALLHHKHHLDL